MSNDHDWLNLVEVSGPFLAVPVLKDVFPQGLEALSSGHPQRLRRTYEEWREAVEVQDIDLTELHAAWVKEVLSTALEIDDAVLRSDDTLPASLTMMMPEHGTTITPDLAVVNPTNADEPLLLIHVYAPDTNLEATHRFGGLAITPADRMVSLLRATGCPIGLVTNGERWMLVHAPVGAVAGFASWYARLWGQEPETLRAFVSLLGVRRFFGPDDGRLTALYERSLKHQDDVTEALGEQVRRAVEVLVQSLDRANQDRNQELLRDVEPRELYEASLTVMMRLVFLLAAEERGLLLLGDPRYDSFYAISSLRMQLRSDSEEILERRRSAWSRLLGLFRGVFGGIEHPTLQLPALGGSLFDPDRYPFLEGRKKGTFWRTDPAEPLPIDDRTVLLLLEAIQTFQGRALSYRALDVEQIGHVYEGLLERTVKRVGDVTLELDGGYKAKSPRITLGELESARLDGTNRVVELLKERSERSEPAIRNALERHVDDRLAVRLLTVCRGDVALRDRILPLANLLRTDPWGYPLVHHKGAFVVVLGADRRESGTHYTPKSLTEKIVEESLTPVAYRGPAEGEPPQEWELKSAEDLLDLKICDPAMGSGAFLVQACRWLSDRLVEAWSITEASGKWIDTEGRILHDDQIEASELLATDVEERAILARRLIAERCLYGVDMNPLAVELAKLSLWLTTVAKGRPFGFLDHNLRSGDSLLGIHDLGQLIELDMNPKGSKQRRLFGNSIRSSVDQAIALRGPAGLDPLVAARADGEGVALGDRAHRRFEQGQHCDAIRDVMAQHLGASARIRAARPFERAEGEPARDECTQPRGGEGSVAQKVDHGARALERRVLQIHTAARVAERGVTGCLEGPPDRLAQHMSERAHLGHKGQPPAPDLANGPAPHQHALARIRPVHPPDLEIGRGQRVVLEGPVERRLRGCRRGRRRPFETVLDLAEVEVRHQRDAALRPQRFQPLVDAANKAIDARDHAVQHRLDAVDEAVGRLERQIADGGGQQTPDRLDRLVGPLERVRGGVAETDDALDGALHARSGVGLQVEEHRRGRSARRSRAHPDPLPDLDGKVLQERHRLAKAASAGHEAGELVDEFARADDQRTDAGADQRAAQDDQRGGEATDRERRSGHARNPATGEEGCKGRLSRAGGPQALGLQARSARRDPVETDRCRGPAMARTAGARVRLRLSESSPETSSRSARHERPAAGAVRMPSARVRSSRAGTDAIPTCAPRPRPVRCG